MSLPTVDFPAFPHSIRDRVGNETWPAASFDGMSLRDWFAGQAITSLPIRSWGDLPADELFKLWSASAYALADAMLAARAK